MSKLVFNRNGGSADEYGHLLILNRQMKGDIVEGLAVTQAASLGMSVLVGTGSGRIATGTYPVSYGYLFGIDTSAGESVTITTANPSNPRLDTIVAYIDLAVTVSTATANNPNNMLKLIAVAGTPASTPAAPTGAAIQTAVGGSNPYTILANVLVGTGVTQVTNANVIDRRLMNDRPSWYKFSAYRSGAMTLGASGSTKIAFDSEEYDPANQFDVASGRHTVTIPGTYTYATSGAVLAGVNFIINIAVYKNGSLYKTLQQASTNSGNTAVNGSVDVPMVANDYVEIFMFSSYTGSVTVNVGQANVWFTGGYKSA